MILRRLLLFGVLPLLGYAVCYFILTYPLIHSFSSHYYCDDGDGPQMIWDIWWVNHALTELKQLPWYTRMLHHPHGATLLLHTLTPFKGLVAIPLSWLLTQAQVYNTLVVLSFALSGLTAFWLAYDTTRSYWPSVLGGYAFAFCAYRFAHAYGHMQLISTEWMPVFVLLWLRLMWRPSIGIALGAAMALFLVLLCDHYQFFFCILIAFLSAGWFVFRRRGFGPWASLRGALAGGAFLLFSISTSGVLAFAMLRAAYAEPIRKAHDPEFFSADLLGPFVPGWIWQYNALTRPIWRPVGSYHETSVSIGVAVLILGIYGFFCSNPSGRMTPGISTAHDERTPMDLRGMWMLLAIVFALLALGPTLNVIAVPVTRWMPYRALEAVLPPLRMAGCPARMMIVTQLAFAVLAAVGCKALVQRISTRRGALLLVALVVAMVVESQPRLPATFDPAVPRWVEVLRDHPEPGAVIDVLRNGYDAEGLYRQTIHQRPIAGGDLSRLTASVDDASQALLDAADRGDILTLHQAGFRFLVVGASRPPLELPIVFEDRLARIYLIEPERPNGK